MGSRLSETLEERRHQVQELRQRLRQEASDRRSVEQAIQAVQQEIVKYENAEPREKLQTVMEDSAAAVASSLQDVAAAGKAAAKAKTGKIPKTKKKKESDSP